MEEIKRQRSRAAESSSPTAKERILDASATSNRSIGRVPSPPAGGIGLWLPFPTLPALKSVPLASLPADLIEDLQRVQKAAQKITSILDLDQLIESVVNEVTHSFGCLEAGIYLHDEERGEMVLAGVRGCACTAKDIG